jgi:hypothetical protein
MKSPCVESEGWRKRRWRVWLPALGLIGLFWWTISTATRGREDKPKARVQRPPPTAGDLFAKHESQKPAGEKRISSWTPPKIGEADAAYILRLKERAEVLKPAVEAWKWRRKGKLNQDQNHQFNDALDFYEHHIRNVCACLILLDPSRYSKLAGALRSRSNLSEGLRGALFEYVQPGEESSTLATHMDLTALCKFVLPIANAELDRRAMALGFAEDDPVRSQLDEFLQLTSYIIPFFETQQLDDSPGDEGHAPP